MYWRNQLALMAGRLLALEQVMRLRNPDAKLVVKVGRRDMN
jgi:hypothetical protein